MCIDQERDGCSRSKRHGRECSNSNTVDYTFHVAARMSSIPVVESTIYTVACTSDTSVLRQPPGQCGRYSTRHPILDTLTSEGDGAKNSIHIIGMKSID